MLSVHYAIPEALIVNRLHKLAMICILVDASQQRYAERQRYLEQVKRHIAPKLPPAIVQQQLANNAYNAAHHCGDCCRSLVGAVYHLLLGAIEWYRLQPVTNDSQIHVHKASPIKVLGKGGAVIVGYWQCGIDRHAVYDVLHGIQNVLTTE